MVLVRLPDGRIVDLPATPPTRKERKEFEGQVTPQQIEAAGGQVRETVPQKVKRRVKRAAKFEAEAAVGFLAPVKKGKKGKAPKTTVGGLLSFKPVKAPVGIKTVLGVAGKPKGTVNPLVPDVSSVIFPNPLPPPKERTLGKKKVGRGTILNQKSIFFK